MPADKRRVARVSDIPLGHAVAVPFAELPGEKEPVQVLISNPAGGKLYATSAKCTHYGAPLTGGVLTKSGRITCPWHGACFRVQTGDIEDAPALNPLQSLPLTIEGEDVFVTADPELLRGKAEGPAPAAGAGTAVVDAASTSPEGVVVVGGGPGALNVAEAARAAGYTGSITIITAEANPPVDRPRLSKALVGTPGPVTWRSPAHFEHVLKVKLLVESTATQLDLANKEVLLKSGARVPYETLVLATGGTPRRLPIPGSKLGEGQLDNILTMRGIDDVRHLVTSLGDKNDHDVVVIGSSFIGCEAAVALASQQRAKSVAVVGMETEPFERVLGPEVGGGIRSVLQETTVIKFYMKAGVIRFEGEQGKVSAVIIKDKEGAEVRLPAQVVVLGVGVAPATEYLRATSGFPELQRDGSVVVDGAMRVQGLGADRIFAIGDIAMAPTRDGVKLGRTEHYNVASNHGRFVGELIAGKLPDTAKFDRIPIFWSALGAQLRYASDGAGPGFDGILLDGKVEDLRFVAYYHREGRVVAVASMGRDPVVMKAAELMRIGRMPPLAKLQELADKGRPLLPHGRPSKHPASMSIGIDGEELDNARNFYIDDSADPADLKKHTDTLRPQL